MYDAIPQLSAADLMRQAHGTADTYVRAAVKTAEELDIYAAGLARNGFFGPDSWYMNGDRNVAYAARARDGGRLSLPVLFLHGEYDYTCETVHSRLAEPMRRDCNCARMRSATKGFLSFWISTPKLRRNTALPIGVGELSMLSTWRPKISTDLRPCMSSRPCSHITQSTMVVGRKVESATIVPAGRTHFARSWIMACVWHLAQIGVLHH